ncbi:hypothetical protein [Amycolatopsis sp. NPDC051903]|uniref:hypothetical protein n=1 Tax=Amycolatopsis sp. NPDC051903 TaxID=3363936 RepID=UPI00379ED259
MQVFVNRFRIDPPWGVGGGTSAHDQAMKGAGLSQAEYEEAKKAGADKRSCVDIAVRVGDIRQENIGVTGIVGHCRNARPATVQPSMPRPSQSSASRTPGRAKK